MKASPWYALFAVLFCLMSGGEAHADYPFDPLLDGRSPGPMGYGPSGYGPESAYAAASPFAPDYGPEYGPDPYLYGDGPAGLSGYFDHDTPIWPGWISGNYQPGSDRSLGGGEWFQPLYQDGRNLWYFDFRGQADSESASEFNVGTGFRTLLDPGWIFGAYAFWDHLNSSNDNTFNQGMIGVEAMDVFWDARLNIYFPESGAERVGPPVARLSNGNVVVQTGFERAYWGMDFEIGNLLWAWGPAAQHELRGFLAVYHFDHSANATQSITGPRGRLEWRWYDLPYFGPGSRFTLGLTAQTDRVRDGQVFGFIELRIPLDPWAHDRRRLSPLHRRMLDRVVRDVDIVSATSRQTEPALNPQTGRPISGVHVIDGDTPYVGDRLNEARHDDLFLLDGSAGEIVLPQTFQLKTGQTVLGGGSSLVVRGATNGLSATFTAPGTRPVVDFDGNANVGWRMTTAGDEAMSTTEFRLDPTGFQMADDTRLDGVDIVGGAQAVAIPNASRVTVQNVNLREFQQAGISVAGSTDVQISHVTMEDADVAYHGGPHPPDPHALPGGTGLFVDHSSRVRFEQSSIHNVNEGIGVLHSNQVTIEDVSISDSLHGAVRLTDTTDVQMSALRLRDIAAQSSFSVTSGSSPVAGIWLHDTEQTLLSDTQLQSIGGYGLFAENARQTRLERVTMTQVAAGLFAEGGADMTLSDVSVSVSPASSTTAASVLLADPLTLNATALTQLQPDGGFVFYDVAGDVLVENSRVTGGVSGAGIEVRVTGDTHTRLKLTNNQVQRLDGQALFVSSWDSSELLAQIKGNSWLGPDGVELLDRSSTLGIWKFSENTIDGPFVARSAQGSLLTLSVKDNLLGGDPMGQITAEENDALRLIYTGNTSTSGAGVLEIVNQNGHLSARIEDNDHEPTTTGDVDPL